MLTVCCHVANEDPTLKKNVKAISGLLCNAEFFFLKKNSIGKVPLGLNCAVTIICT